MFQQYIEVFLNSFSLMLCKLIISPWNNRSYFLTYNMYCTCRTIHSTFIWWIYLYRVKLVYASHWHCYVTLSSLCAAITNVYIITERWSYKNLWNILLIFAVEIIYLSLHGLWVLTKIPSLIFMYILFITDFPFNWTNQAYHEHENQ